MCRHVSLPTSDNRASSPSRDWEYPSLLICVILLCETLFLLTERRIAGQWGFSLDDSWIHATIASNLATGSGYSFNRGEWVAGSTAPLFTILLAVGYRIFGDIVWSAKVLGILFQCATAVIVITSMQILTPKRRDLSLAAGLRLELVILAGGVLLWETLGVRPMAEAHAWNVQNINGMHRQLGEMAKRMTRPGDAIAVNDIGAIGYFSDRYVVDLMGLISPLRSLPENLSIYKPSLLIIFPNWFPTYTVYDSLHNTVYYLDADSTHKYSALFLVKLEHNTVASRRQMCVYVRQRVEDPPPRYTWKYRR